MKKFIFTSVLAFITANVFSQNSTYVNGYFKSNGTYVSGYYRTMPNSTVYDNYSTFPNINPYTGVRGSIHYDFPSNTYTSKSLNWPVNSSYDVLSTPIQFSSPSVFYTPSVFTSPNLFSSPNIFSTPSLFSSPIFNSSYRY